MKRNIILKNTAIGAAIIIAGIAAGVLLLAFAYLIPQRYIYANTKSSIEILHDETVYPKLFEGITATQLDNWTDAVMLNMTYYRGDSFADDMLRSIRVYVDNADNPMEAFYNYMSGEDGEYYPRAYGRYWHGYQAILAPLLVFFNITSIRYLNMVAQIGLTLAVLFTLHEKKRKDMLIPYAIMWISLMPIALFCSMQFSSTFYVMSGLSLLVAVKSDKYSFAKMCFAFEIAGVLEAYLDFLTYPLAALTVPAIMWFALDVENKAALKQRIWQLVCLTGAWLCGYAGMWSGKWIVATLFTEDNVIMNAIDAIQMRSSTHNGDSTFSYLDAVKWNIASFGLYRCLATFVVVFMIAVFIWIFIARRKRNPAYAYNWQTLLVIALCALMPFGWYMGTINHSYIHHWFTFRELAASIYGGFTVLYLGFCLDKKGECSASA